MIVADTNVVSEFMCDEPDSAVLSWASSLGPSDLTICVVTVEEIERGIRRLPTGKRRHQLEQRWQRLVAAFHEAIVVYDVEAAEATAAVPRLLPPTTTTDTATDGRRSRTAPRPCVRTACT